jgi:hypothetical protein
MIDELYDSVLSISDKLGYLDKVTEFDDKKSLLKWSSNNLFTFNTYKIYKPNYPIKAFSHDICFKVPYSTIIKEDGTIE